MLHLTEWFADAEFLIPAGKKPSTVTLEISFSGKLRVNEIQIACAVYLCVSSILSTVVVEAGLRIRNAERFTTHYTRQ